MARRLKESLIGFGLLLVAGAITLATLSGSLSFLTISIPVEFQANLQSQVLVGATSGIGISLVLLGGLMMYASHEQKRHWYLS